ncbi:MAG TPA: hypothetical protein VND96_04645 [Candidatus Micrarchaeaceae archaeon]|nr:hypothetical protein [Candidatus Micrarchaeaceae archaeon]
MSAADNIPMPPDEVLVRLAGIAFNADELLAADQQVQKATVGLRTIKTIGAERLRTSWCCLRMPKCVGT